MNELIVSITKEMKIKFVVVELEVESLSEAFCFQS